MEAANEDLDGNLGPVLCWSVPLATAGELQQHTQIGVAHPVTSTSAMGILHTSQVPAREGTFYLQDTAISL